MENEFEYKFHEEDYYRDVVDYYLNQGEKNIVYGMNERMGMGENNENPMEEEELDEEGDAILDDFQQYEGNTVDKSRDELETEPFYVKDTVPSNMQQEQTTQQEQEMQQESLGTLKVQVYTARRTLPVEDATVAISRNTPEGEQEIVTLTTNNSGTTQTVSLPGVPASLTEVPGLNLEHYFKQYSYNIEVTHPDYVSVLFKNVPIFQGIQSIQSIDLIPKAIAQDQNKEEIVDETEPDILGEN